MFKAISMTVALAIAGVSAEAATMKAVWTGTVNSGYDQTGEFGTPNADLTGLSYVLTYIYDTVLGTRDTLAGQYDMVGGGEIDSTTSPMLSTVLRINGIDQNIGAGYVGLAATAAGTTVATSYSYESLDSGTSSGVEFYNFVRAYGGFGTAGPIDLDLPVSLSDFVGSYTTFNNQFQLSSYDAVTFDTIRYVGGSLAPEALTITRVGEPPVSPVPLPAAFPLFAVALGGLALARRSRIS